MGWDKNAEKCPRLSVCTRAGARLRFFLVIGLVSALGIILNIYGRVYGGDLFVGKKKKEKRVEKKSSSTTRVIQRRRQPTIFSRRR